MLASDAPAGANDAAPQGLGAVQCAFLMGNPPSTVRTQMSVPGNLMLNGDRMLNMAGVLAY